MGSLGLVILAVLLFIYSFGVTIALLVMIMTNLSKTKKLRLMSQELDALRAQKNTNASQPSVKQPSVAQTVNTYSYTAPVSTAAAKAPARPAVQTVPPVSATVSTVPAPATPVSSPVPAPAALKPSASVQVQKPAPAAQAKPVKTREKVKFSSINISFAVGVLLITIVGAVFISSSWGFMNDAVRAGVLIGVVALVFFLSYLSGKVLKLKQTGFAFYTLGSLLLPVVTCGIGAMSLFGEWFSFTGGGAAIVAACAALLFGVAGYVGVRIYKSGAYYGIMYLGFTWTLLFVAAQFAYELYDRVGCCFLALSAASLAANLFLRDKRSEEIKFFKLYSELITYISLGAILIVVWNFKYIPVSIGLGILIVTLLTGRKKWMGYVAPVVMFVFSLYATSFTEYEYNDRTYPLLVYALLITAFFVLLKAIKRNSIVSDLVLSFSLAGGIFAGWIEYRPEFMSFYLVTMGVILITTLVAGYSAFYKGQNRIVSYILSAVASLTSIALVYCAGTGIFYDNSLGKALQNIASLLGTKLPDHINTGVIYSASAMAYTAALALYILCNYKRQKHPSLRICSYAFMFAAFVSALPTLSGHLMYLAICTSAIVRSVRMSVTEKETATKVSRVLSAISHYTAMAFMAAAFGNPRSVIYMLCLLMVFASLYIRVVFGGSKWQRYITPAIAAFISLYATSFADIPSAPGVEVEMAVFGICLLVFYIFTEFSKLRNAITDLLYPVIFFAAAFSGKVVFDDQLAARYVVSIVLIAASVLLMAICAFRKDNRKEVRVISLIAGTVFSSTLFYSVGTYIFRGGNEDLPVVFGGGFALVGYIVCAIVIPKIKGKTIACWSSYAYYACSVFMLIKAANSIRPIRITVSSLLIIAALAALISRYIARPGKHPDIRSCAAVVFALCSASMFISAVFYGPSYSHFPGIIFYGVVIAAGFIPQIRSHEVIGKYVAVADITSCLIGSLYCIWNETMEVDPWIGAAVAALFVVLLYFKKNTVVAIVPLLISTEYLTEALDPVSGQYFICCATGILLIGLGLLLHKKVYTKPLYLDYLTYVSILFPIIASDTQYYDIAPFAILLTIALILVSHAIRFPKAKALLLSISTSFMCLAIISLPIIKELPELFKGEVIMLLILLDVFLIRNVIKPGKESTMRVIWIVTVSVCLVIEGISAAATGEILDLLITGIVSVAIFIYAFIAKDKSWFLLSVIAIIAIAVYLSATFWASKAWLVYLLVVGIILISMAAINEYGKRKAELNGEQSEGGGAGVKRFFEEWKW